MKAAFLFSGQGAQAVGMGQDLYRNSPVAKKIYDEADSLLPWKVTELCFNGPAEKLTESRYCQVCIFTTSMACLAAFYEKYGNDFPAVGAAGLSLGEYGAFCCAGFFRFADALKTVEKRAILMDEACRQEAGTMACILSRGDAPLELIRSVCEECSIDVANYNSPSQIVLSGTVEGVKNACGKLSGAEGIKRIVPLNVAGAYHSRMMRKAGEGLKEVLAGVPVSAMKMPVVQNFTGTSSSDAAVIKENLVHQVAGSVRFVECIRTLSGLGADTFIEFGPGTVLTGLVKKIDAGKAVFNISDMETLSKFTY